jgi:glycosyltransferase involved in cell wall biosynthesis
MGFGHALPMGQAGLGQVDPRVQRAYGDDPLGLWGETDPEELVAWWLKIAANRQEWRRNGRQYADAVRSLSWRESMRKLLSLVEQIPEK